MTDDIAALVGRLRRKFSFYRDPDNSARWIAHERHLDEDCAEAAAALSRMMSPPLPNEIAELIEQLDYWSQCPLPRFVEWPDRVRKGCGKAATALARLATPPLPDEIAGLIERAESSIRAYEITHNEDSQACRLLRYLADALRALAQENERLNGIVEDQREDKFWKDDEETAGQALRLRALAQENERLQDKLTRQIDKTEVEAERGGNIENDLDAARARIDELEAENERLKEAYSYDAVIAGLEERIAELEAGRDLLRKMKDRALESAALNGEALKQCQLLLCPDFEKCSIVWFETCLCGFEDGSFANAVPKNRRAEKAEAERDLAHEALQNMGLNWNAQKAGTAMQLRAIRAKTFEECLGDLIDQGFPSEGKVCNRIRALVQTDEPHPTAFFGALNDRPIPTSGPAVPSHERMRRAQTDESKTESGE